MAKATSQEVDRMNRESNRLSRDQREPNRSRGASQGRHHRPRSLGATLNRGGHTSGSDGNRYHSNISSSGPDTDRNMGQKIFHKKITFFLLSDLLFVENSINSHAGGVKKRARKNSYFSRYRRGLKTCP